PGAVIREMHLLQLAEEIMPQAEHAVVVDARAEKLFDDADKLLHETKPERDRRQADDLHQRLMRQPGEKETVNVVVARRRADQRVDEDGERPRLEDADQDRDRHQCHQENDRFGVVAEIRQAAEHVPAVGLAAEAKKKKKSLLKHALTPHDEIPNAAKLLG